MRRPIVFMFSGQGSQYYHMGKELYCQNAVFRRWMLTLNDIVYQNSGLSILDTIYDQTKSKFDTFDDLWYTHPAIFMVEYSLARVLIESGFEPDYVLGASIGEFVAAAVTGVISLEETLECILKQVELVKNHCQAGRMIAIIDNPDLYNRSYIISLHSELAAVNYSSHFVVAGDREKLSIIKEDLQSKDAFFRTLPVRYGFHSSNIDPIENDYKSFLRNISLKKPAVPVISCLLSDYVSEFSSGYFWDVVRQPINFQKTICKIEENDRLNYIDLGPSGTLANFVKQNLSRDAAPRVYDVLNLFGQDMKNLEKVKESFH